MNNFSINPNFNMQGFDNSINEFNKSFSESINKQVDGKNFQDIFNSISQTNSVNQPLSAQADMTIGLDTINAQKLNMSPTAKLYSDIGSNLSKSIGELNTVQKQAETDFETFASGGDISVHDVMISTQKSNLAMQMAIQLRNQFITSYNEFKNMSI